MVEVVKSAIKTQNTNHVIFPGLSKKKNLQKRVRKKGLRYISHPRMKNFRANSCSSDMTQIS